jgi:hypothetical protein
MLSLTVGVFRVDWAEWLQFRDVEVREHEVRLEVLNDENDVVSRLRSLNLLEILHDVPQVSLDVAFFLNAST